MEIRKIKYPYEPDSEHNNVWYKFGQSDGAVKVDNKQIEEWINNCVKDVKKALENGEQSPYSFVASGDTFVVCFYSQDMQDNVFDDNNYFSIIVAKNYEQGDFFISDLKIEGSNGENTKCEIGDITLNDIIEAVENKETIKLKGYEINIRKVD